MRNLALFFKKNNFEFSLLQKMQSFAFKIFAHPQNPPLFSIRDLREKQERKPTKKTFPKTRQKFYILRRFSPLDTRRRIFWNAELSSCQETIPKIPLQIKNKKNPHFKISQRRGLRIQIKIRRPKNPPKSEMEPNPCPKGHKK